MLNFLLYKVGLIQYPLNGLTWITMTNTWKVFDQVIVGSALNTVINSALDGSGKPVFSYDANVGLRAFKFLRSLMVIFIIYHKIFSHFDLLISCRTILKKTWIQMCSLKYYLQQEIIKTMINILKQSKH